MNHYKTVFNAPSRLCSELPNTTYYSWFSVWSCTMLFLVPVIIIWPFPSTSFSTLLSALENSPVEATGPGSLILGFLLETADGRLGWRGGAGRRGRLEHFLLRLPLWDTALVWPHHWMEGYCSSQAPCFFMTLSFDIQRSLLSLVLPCRPRSDQSSEPASPGILALPYTPPHLYN